MKKGYIKSFKAENKKVRSKNSYYEREERLEFRTEFKVPLHKSESENSDKLKTLKWGHEIELPDGLSDCEWTKVKSGNKTGFVQSTNVVQIAYVNKKALNKSPVILKTENDYKKKLLWGDMAQIINYGVNRCEVRCRGIIGMMDTAALSDEALLEVYFIDVGQGDGTLVVTPERKHLLIDGGLERDKQQTGKNAADFVDWKFFMDYGDHTIILESMMASHSDNDHYGGLHDLLKIDEMADRELDCAKVVIDTFHHPGLSRWSNNANSVVPHKQGLGSFENGLFTQLLNDRADAESAVDNNSIEKLSKPWKGFIKSILDNSGSTKVKQVALEQDKVQRGDKPPLLWRNNDDCDIRILAPITKEVNGKVGLPNFGKKSFNTNGHSICLRVEYGSARILLTGDLNKASMDWLQECYGDRMGVWECDVAKACHHGSHNISYKFLEKIHAAATIISSGDAEGHAHPRPEVVAASATTGYTSIDRREDKLITPLIYMTEVERSVSLGKINKIDFRNLKVNDTDSDGTILLRHLDELNDKAYLTPEKWRSVKYLNSTTKKNQIIRQTKNEEKPILEAMESDMETNATKVEFNITVPNGPLSPQSKNKRAWRSKLMDKNHYGLVNVRTDGDVILCATMDETEDDWILHTFDARF